MTIKFHPDLAKSYINRGILQLGYSTACAISIYSGTQPSAADIVANWANYKSSNSNFLAHYTGALWTQPLAGKATFANLSTIPPAVTPLHNGVGAWAILWASDVTLSQAGDATIANTDFIVVPVSLVQNNGVVKFSDTLTFSTSTPVAIAEGFLYCNIG